MSIPIQLNPLGINQNKRKDPLTLIATQANSSVKLTAIGNPVINGLQYRTNLNSEWNKYNIDTVIYLDNIGDVVQFQNTNNVLSTEHYNYVQFIMTGKIEASGNIQSLLNYSNKCTLYCFRSLFQKCTSLIKAPELPCINLYYGCYAFMFSYCSSLIEAPELPATKISGECYAYMFSGCSSLIEAPELPSLKMEQYCYQSMFRGTSLTNAPELPAITLAHSCYQGMFYNCTSLVKAPELPVTNLNSKCYSEMFYGCSSLTKAPELPATTLASYCYERMFEGCTSLIETSELPAGILTDYCYNLMFSDDCDINKIDVNFESWPNNNATSDWVKNVYQDGVFLKPENLLEEYGYSKIPINFKPFDKNKPLTLTADESSTIQITKSGNPSGVELYYNKNGSGWVSYSLNSVISLNANEYVQFKNTNSNYQFSTGRNDFYGFVMTGKIKASGNVQSLVNFSDTADWYAFRKLFQNCRSLIEAPTVLPAKHVLGYAYASMFGKTSITNMPIMLAEDFSDYACYYMFEECPINYAKILDKKGINGNRCFESMFNNCSNLKIIDVDFTTWTVDSDKDEHRNWVSGVSASGTFLKKQILNKTFATNRIPNNWNVYNPLKFIQATETQYINTNITPSENFEIEVCGAGLLNFGSRTNYLLNEFRFSIGVNQIDFAFGNDLYIYSKTGIGNEKYIIKYGTDGKFYVNNKLIYSSSSSISQYYPIYAFAINSNGTPIFNSIYPSQIFRIKMWRDGVLISDIIPVDNNGGCLFDRLNNICFTNSGTGNFVI